LHEVSCARRVDAQVQGIAEETLATFSLEGHDGDPRLVACRVGHRGCLRPEDRHTIMTHEQSKTRSSRQDDLETMRPAVMVLMPHRASDPPQVASVPREDLHRAAELLAFVGERLP
jgi:hypothetical protein